MISRRHIILGGGLALGGAAAGLKSLPAKNPDLPALGPLIPSRFETWRPVALGQVVLPPKDSKTARIYEEVLTLRYASPAQKLVTLVVAYQGVQTFAAQLHRPEICYPASNFQLREQQPADFETSTGLVPAQRFTAQRGTRQDEVLFWTRIGNDFPASLWSQRALIARAALRGQYLDGVVMRLSTPKLQGTEQTAFLQKFARDLSENLPQQARIRLYGR